MRPPLAIVSNPRQPQHDAEGRTRTGSAHGSETVLRAPDPAPSTSPWPLASSKLADPTPLQIGGHAVGGHELFVIAGPCAVESAEQLARIGDTVRAAGAQALRGGAFKPRTSPYSFQGLALEGLELLRDYKQSSGHLVVTEVMDAAHLDAVAEVADVLQIGARNMHNSYLLDAVGQTRKPVLLKRSFGATASELLHAAEYILARGNAAVLLCERGIRTYETSTRFTLDVGTIAWLKQRTHLPVIVDPSHAAGVSTLVEPLAAAGIAAGADGLLVEVHHDPTRALSDADQALDAQEFAALMDHLRPLAAALGRGLPVATATVGGRS